MCKSSPDLIHLLFSRPQKYEEMNFEPNGTTVTGSCGVNSSELVLVSNTMNISFTFLNVSPQHHNVLHFFIFSRFISWIFSQELM